MNERIPKYEEFVNELLSTIPNKQTAQSDTEILRAAILAELDAINVYTQMAEVAKDPKVKETLLDIAREEKTHIGEFQELLKQLDPEYVKELENGKKEVNEASKQSWDTDKKFDYVKKNFDNRLKWLKDDIAKIEKAFNSNFEKMKKSGDSLDYRFLEDLHQRIYSCATDTSETIRIHRL